MAVMRASAPVAGARKAARFTVQLFYRRDAWPLRPTPRKQGERSNSTT